MAVKVVRTQLGAPRSLLRRFLREAESVALLDHPGIVRMLHVDVADDGTLFQVQELVDGETLSQVLRRHGRFSPGAVGRVLAALADALASAHALGLVHRDVKPANVILTAGAPGLKLLDFGVATFRQQLEAGTDGDTPTDLPTIPEPMTRTGALIGTPGFIGPEQAVTGEISDRTDVYALGVVGVLLLTGEHPIAGRAPTDLRERAPGASDVLIAMVTGAMAPSPADRPSARALSDALTADADAAGLAPLEVLVAQDALRTHHGDDQPTLPELDA